MTEYKCPSCNYKTDIRQDILRHINKVKRCINIESNENITMDDIIKTKTEFICSCKSTFIRKYSFERHQRNCVKEKISELEQKIGGLENVINTQLQLQPKTQTQTHSQVIQNQNIQTQNIQNAQVIQNIQIINNYNDSNLEHITNSDYVGFMKLRTTAVPDLIKKIHFDEDYPQNHNVYIPNKKNKEEIMVLENNKWNLKNKNDDFVENMLVMKLCVLENWSLCDEIKEKYPNIDEDFAKISHMLNDNEKVRNEVKEQIFSLLYNYKDMIIETKTKKDKADKLKKLSEESS